MDVSVVAAVGSFFMSERVLKPKATVLFILGMILAYDLTTKTHDVSSLRVYRGPALIAFTLLMCAFSLRTWRRNGVACDELLFLPGTAHGITHGVDSPPPSVGGGAEAPTNSNNNSNNAPEDTNIPVPESVVAAHGHSRSEGDVAAGGPHPDALELRRRTRSMEEDCHHEARNKANVNHKRGISVEEMRQNSGVHSQNRQLGDVELTATKSPNNRSLRSDSFDSSLGWGSDDDDVDRNNSNEHNNRLELSDTFDPSMGTQEERECLTGHRNLLCRPGSQYPEEGGQRPNDGNPPGSLDDSANHDALDMHHFRENHPRITRIGSFFFFRSSSSTTQNAVYAPSGPAVVGAALDLSMPVLFNFHLFIEAFNHIKPKDADSEAPAKILPIIFLSVLIVRSVVPPGRRGRFWSTLKFTVMSPFHRVRFRDAFVGDVLTSMVRPGQDILFALSYYVTVIWGSVTGKYGLTESGRILESSFTLHNVLLPSAALLPLWWRFLQTLRQAYDEDKRWPHLGNAFKYLTATLVILYGMTHPEKKRSPYWIILFLFSLAYQIWWDVVMDWDLLEIPPHHYRSTLDAISVENWLTNISSLSPDSHILITLQMYIFTPLAERWRRMNARLSSLQHVRLRTKRLYKTETFYWRILFFNIAVRFTWMLCFIPAYRLSSSGEEKVATFSSDVNSYVGVLLPVAEIVRRCLWGLLLLERKTIQMTDDDAAYSRLDSTGGDYPKGEENDEDVIDADETDQLSGGDHSQGGKGAYNMYLPLFLSQQQMMQHDGSGHSWSLSTTEPFRALASYFDFGDDFVHNLFLFELGLWAAAFVGLGCWAAS